MRTEPASQIEKPCDDPEDDDADGRQSRHCTRHAQGSWLIFRRWGRVTWHCRASNARLPKAPIHLLQTTPDSRLLPNATRTLMSAGPKAGGEAWAKISKIASTRPCLTA